MRKVLAMIPARLGSARLKNKMLIEVSGKPIICQTIERVLEVELVGRVALCTDDETISDLVTEHFKDEPKVVVCLERLLNCFTGCDRTSLTLLRNPKLKQGLADDCILHVHGDEVSISPDALHLLIQEHSLSVPHASMTQLVVRTRERDSRLRSSCKVDVDWAGVVRGYSRDEDHFFTALGAFTFDPCALLAFHRFDIGQEELKLNIEQLRFVELGLVVKAFDSGLALTKTSVDTQDDLNRLVLVSE